MKLYEITAEIKRLDVTVDDTDSKELESIFDDIDMIFTEKVLATVRLIKSWISEKEAVKVEKQRLADREKTLDNKINSLKEYIKINMIQTNILQVKDELFTVSVRKSPVSCEVLDPISIPDDYKEYYVRTFNQKIIEHFKATGEQFKGVKYNTENTHLEIR